MPKEILIQLHTALYGVTPIAEERDLIIAEMGETIWIETIEKVLESLEEGPRNKVVEAMNEGDYQKVSELLENSPVDIESILSAVAVDVMDDVMKDL